MKTIDRFIDADGERTEIRPRVQGDPVMESKWIRSRLSESELIHWKEVFGDLPADANPFLSAMTKTGGHDPSDIERELVRRKKPRKIIWDVDAITPAEFEAKRSVRDLELSQIKLFHNPQHNCRTGRIGSGVVCISTDGRRIPFSSMTDAAKQFQCGPGAIWRAVNKGYRVRGMRFERAA